ncbi:orotate phosphoribosyltransferase [Wigglesworthia glossinidia endosymbiont of Glossina morsitans morsitans (Yale colony)]|uniref:Orotate phosphoribosyltransferase n=1 Tax=Wigglesworthia glossinidia endosymbiont of Glossina morsitans morsitans (Yale colony) TaxID=1142511 RepID=H6Q4R5_WIGGL|nr:orotate phosphoribosyltransferase [Wigglesworthia glossinidia]AFA41198.1 orotate phosphoribosyltransferase [Wigglesworthia glossinidia endosymbiont of Glossina morsitans morsitans (Yale colony)]
MKNYQYEFIRYAIDKNALQFGKFILKSGRISPYFFDISKFNSGKDLIFLGKMYVKTLLESKISYDMLFGLSYKGIAIALSSSIILSYDYNQNVCICFNRKEYKNHGEKGLIVGKRPKGKIILMDDVVTSGSTIQKIISIMNPSEIHLSGMIIALDRQEQDLYKQSAIKNLQKNFNFKIKSIIKLTDLILFLEQNKNIVHTTDLCSIKQYKIKYGI